MPTLTEPGVDVEIIEALDFEPDIACEIKMSGCAEKAEVLVICRACHYGTPACPKCVANIRRTWASMTLLMGPIVTATCVKCNTTTETCFDDGWNVVSMKAGS